MVRTSSPLHCASPLCLNCHWLTRLSLLPKEGLHLRKGAAATTADKATATYTWQDVAKHNTAKSAWVIIRGVVYDVTGACIAL